MPNCWVEHPDVLYRVETETTVKRDGVVSFANIIKIENGREMVLNEAGDDSSTSDNTILVSSYEGFAICAEIILRDALGEDWARAYADIFGEDLEDFMGAGDTFTISRNDVKRYIEALDDFIRVKQDIMEKEWRK